MGVSPGHLQSELRPLRRTQPIVQSKRSSAGSRCRFATKTSLATRGDNRRPVKLTSTSRTGSEGGYLSIYHRTHIARRHTSANGWLGQAKLLPKWRSRQRIGEAVFSPLHVSLGAFQ